MGFITKNAMCSIEKRSMMNTLFIDKDNRSYGAEDVLAVLKEIGADDCETLFIHSDLLFGRAPTDFNRREYLGILYQVIEKLEVRNVIVPAFTYSFCNKEDFDVRASRTSMGAFSEFVRRKEGRYRTHDPLLSVSVPLCLKRRFEQVGHHSLGEGSAFDILHTMDGVKFLFLGARQGECFTYVHYVEKMLDVPYRFDMAFQGRVKDEEGKVEERTQTIHTRCYGVRLPESYDYFEQRLIEEGYVKKKRFGDSFVSCLAETDAYQQIIRAVRENPNYFVPDGYTDEDLIHQYAMGLEGGRITHC